MLIDTHAHLYHERFDADREAAIGRARDAGVEVIIMPAIDLPSIEDAIELCRKHEGLYAMAALHPSETRDADESDLEAVAAFCDAPEVVAVGESGLDYYWDRSFDDRQHAFFRSHVRLAVEKDLPLILHNREASDDLVRILYDERKKLASPERLRGIFHCFTGPALLARMASELGFMIGLGGILTFKNSDLEDIVRDIPLSQIVVETDAPYLAPEPHRGGRNEPAFTRQVAEKLAAVKDVPIEEVARVTTANARALFGLA